MGNATEVRFEQFLNTLCPIVVTLSGIIIDCRPQYANASESILVTELGIIIVCKLRHELKALLPIETIECGMLIEIRPSHPANEDASMVDTDSGISNDDSCEQPPNAPSPMSVTLSGIVIEEILLHP